MFEPTREAGLERLRTFLDSAGNQYRDRRNFAVAQPIVSQLSPWLRHRLISEEEVLRYVLERHDLATALSFVQEVFWRGYFKGWLQQHPTVWSSYKSALSTARRDAGYFAATGARTGIDCFDHWCRQLTTTGYLHNHARMWFASIWIFTLRLPWELGAAFFLEHLVDADPASNTLSWRWVAGLHTKGKNYLATAENIARFTEGQFHPVGQLNEAAAPIDEATNHPLVPFPSAPSPEFGPHLHVLTEEDCCGGLELVPDGAPVLGLVSPQSSDFAQGAVTSAATARGGETYIGHKWSEAIIAAAHQAQISDVVIDFMPVGPAAEGMDAACAQVLSHGLRVHHRRRHYDRLIWPHATKGFFKLKSRSRTCWMRWTSNMPKGVQIVWFKRDLRTHDHAPLAQAAATGAPVLPLYIVEPEYWAQPFASRRHWSFIRDGLCELQEDLARLGQPLIVQRGDACTVINTLRQSVKVTDLWAHEETADLWTYERDKRMRRMCRETGIQIHELPSNGVVRRLGTRDRWNHIRNQRMSEPLIPKPTTLVPTPNLRSEPLPCKSDPLFGAPISGQTQQGGRRVAVSDLKSFLSHRAESYLRDISAPGRSEHSCSRLSAHLAWGTLSVREVAQALDRRRKDLSPLEKKRFGRNLSAFGSRLAWRCHFVQKLEDQPSLETHCMHPAFEGLREAEFRQENFDAWAQGRTGYPFVDACMRSLIEQGWITFRMRAMLVSFASYQLWLDWRVTAPYLAQLFTDYEPGIHYSQFQMQSGVTGINAIRVYNPVKQGLDQDPDGVFMRRWVPELRGLAAKDIHTPWLSANNLFSTAARTEYPNPIVDNETSSKHAKDRIFAVRKTAGFQAAKKTVIQRHASRKTRSRSQTSKPSTSAQPDLFD